MGGWREQVKACGDTVGCTITPHHLALIVDDWAGQPFHYCKPVAKYPSDRAALRGVIAEGERLLPALCWPAFSLSLPLPPPSRHSLPSDLPSSCHLPFALVLPPAFPLPSDLVPASGPLRSRRTLSSSIPLYSIAALRSSLQHSVSLARPADSLLPSRPASSAATQVTRASSSAPTRPLTPPSPRRRPLRPSAARRASTRRPSSSRCSRTSSRPSAR